MTRSGPAPPAGPPEPTGVVLDEGRAGAKGSGCALLSLGLLGAAGFVAGLVWLFMVLTRPGQEPAPGERPGLWQWPPDGADGGPCRLEILEIENAGGTRYFVRGVARVPAGARIWLLAHGEETNGKLWPQIPPVEPRPDGRFSELIYLGGYHQRGRHFEVALTALDAAAHRRMQALWKRGMRNDWVAVELPSGVCPPSVRSIERPWL